MKVKHLSRENTHRATRELIWGKILCVGINTCIIICTHFKINKTSSAFLLDKKYDHTYRMKMNMDTLEKQDGVLFSLDGSKVTFIEEQVHC